MKMSESTQAKMNRLEPTVKPKGPGAAAAAAAGPSLLTTLSVSRLVATAFRKGNAVGPKMLGLKPTSLRNSKSLNEIEMGTIVQPCTQS